VSVYKASELVSVKSKADEVVSQKAALDDHIATLKVTNNGEPFVMFMIINQSILFFSVS